ncbi:hypothetical protein Tcan_16864 [Toxocara canis]|uniref:Uncharacterized protein n=1 Tax=Toxocara canis TaxID=6265 RepID=A0A0B2V923_TOXCA|nr:hypothetical protein Tcan_16864 [Toxocara canis]
MFAEMHLFDEIALGNNDKEMPNSTDDRKGCTLPKVVITQPSNVSLLSDRKKERRRSSDSLRTLDERSNCCVLL